MGFPLPTDSMADDGHFSTASRLGDALSVAGLDLSPGPARTFSRTIAGQKEGQTMPVDHGLEAARASYAASGGVGDEPARSPEWDRVENEHLQREPRCVCCGNDWKA